MNLLGHSVRSADSISRAQRDREQTGQIAAVVKPTEHYLRSIFSDVELVKGTDTKGIDIPLAHLLGIPLKLICLANVATSVHTPNYNKNYVTPLLGVVVDPEDVMFGRYVAEKFVKTTTGSIMLCRSDGKDFGQEQAEALLAYCQGELGMMYDVIPRMREAGIEATAVAKGVVEKSLTPAAYAKFWEAYRVEKIKVDQDWESLTCPVVVKLSKQEGPGGDGCSVCGAMEGEGGGALLQCEKCRKQRYCSRDCQRKDWKAHKASCVAA